MLLNALDVVQYIVLKLGKIEHVKLHRLLYYCQVWSLVWDNEKLFKDDIHILIGPVVLSFWHRYNDKFYIDTNDNIFGIISKISKQQKETIDGVLEFYGDKTPDWLTELSIMEGPILNTKKRGDKIVDTNEIQEYYKNLLK